MATFSAFVQECEKTHGYIYSLAKEVAILANRGANPRVQETEDFAIKRLIWNRNGKTITRKIHTGYNTLNVSDPSNGDCVLRFLNNQTGNILYEYNTPEPIVVFSVPAFLYGEGADGNNGSVTIKPMFFSEALVELGKLKNTIEEAELNLEIP